MAPVRVGITTKYTSNPCLPQPQNYTASCWVGPVNLVAGRANDDIIPCLLERPPAQNAMNSSGMHIRKTNATLKTWDIPK